MRPVLRTASASLLTVLMGVAAGCSSPAPSSDSQPGTSSRVATGWAEIDDGPALALPDGEPLSDRPWRRDTRWQLVNFWSSTCVPCRTEMPELAALSGRDDLQVIGVSRDQFARYARAFEDEVDATFPSWLDPDGEYAAQLRRIAPVDFLPLSALVDQGRVVAVHVGPLKDLTGLEELVDSPE